jgi:hypothetical protein
MAKVPKKPKGPPSDADRADAALALDLASYLRALAAQMDDPEPEQRAAASRVIGAMNRTRLGLKEPHKLGANDTRRAIFMSLEQAWVDAPRAYRTVRVSVLDAKERARLEGAIGRKLAPDLKIERAEEVEPNADQRKMREAFAVSVACALLRERGLDASPALVRDAVVTWPGSTRGKSEALHALARSLGCAAKTPNTTAVLFRAIRKDLVDALAAENFET